MNVSVVQVGEIIKLFRDDADISWELFCGEENLSGEVVGEVAQKVGVPPRAVLLVFKYGHLPPKKLARAFSLIGPRTSPEKVESIMRRISPQSWDWDWGTGK
ncbi:hypothetical protein KJ678_03915 [Patescibacteria group bacterium]|nr:hypothetical protein [Patescibacteria group bacterium]